MSRPSMSCTCARQADRFAKPVVTADPRGNLHMLVGGMALKASLEIVKGDNGVMYVTAKVPLAFVELLPWDGLLRARRAGEEAVPVPPQADHA